MGDHVNLTRVTERGAAVALASIGTTIALLASTAPAAHADVVTDNAPIVLVTPDPSDLTAACVTTIRTTSTIGGFPTVYQSASLNVSSSGCGAGVRWTPTVTIIDESPGRATRATSSTGAAGNPAFASDSQNVTYGIGVREVGIITFQYEATSRLGTYCVADKFRFDVVSRWATLIARGSCTL